jgi:transposase
LVPCVDEKSQCQALERTQPLLPMGLGYVEGVTHDYVLHGTTTLFAELNATTGEVITQCKSRHRHQEFIAFLNHIDRAVPANLDVHLIVDNYATHKHPKVKAWLAKRARYHMHFTLTYSSWLNQVERRFGLITQQAIRRGSFESVRQLIASIQRYVDQYNLHKRPFMCRTGRNLPWREQLGNRLPRWCDSLDVSSEIGVHWRHVESVLDSQAADRDRLESFGRQQGHPLEYRAQPRRRPQATTACSASP